MARHIAAVHPRDDVPMQVDALSGGGALSPLSEETQWLRRRVWLALPVVALWLAGLGQVRSAEAQGLKLFTSREAQQLRLTDEEWRPRVRTRGAPPAGGPRIVMQSPQVRETPDGYLIEAATPMDFLIRFEETRAPVDMDSLKVEARKGIFSKSLTATLRPYVQGMAIQAMRVQIPRGRFLISVEIVDRNRVKTVENYRLDIR